MNPLILWLVPGLTLARLAEWVDRGFRIQTSLDAALDPLTQIADGQAVLIVVMANALPTWIAEARSNPATRRIPIVAIADSEQQISAAHYVGIKHILSSAEAVNVDLLIAFLYPLNRPAVADSCAEPLPELALKGLHEFNAREFFECHETLETAWKADSGSARDLYRVILQVGLAYFQIERSNYAGAIKMFLRTQQWFALLPNQCRGVDLARLRSDAAAARSSLEALGPDRIVEFDQTLIKPIQWTT